MKVNEIAENISHTAKRIHDIERKHKVKPGTEEWFKLWFSLPYLKESTILEGYKLQLERDDDMYVLHITDSETGKRTEVRGKSGYESGNYDPEDPLHQLLDKIGKASNISELINGEVVGINPKHPDGASAKAATDVAFDENTPGTLLHKINWGGQNKPQQPKQNTQQQPKAKPRNRFDKLVNWYKELFDEIRLEENFAENKIKYSAPNFEYEWEEAERYPEFRKIGKDAWIELAKKGKAVTIRSAKDINNTDAAEPNSFASLDKTKQGRALDQLKSGTVEMPIVAVYSDGWKELVGGNTRLTAMLAQNGKATVWAFKVPDEVAELAENFADGKVKGKSRPGRVKRAGASCKGSVSELRRKAKKYSGERGKMYHWCANMKGGKK